MSFRHFEYLIQLVIRIFIFSQPQQPLPGYCNPIPLFQGNREITRALPFSDEITRATPLSGIAFYTSNCKEVVSPERKLVLYDKKTHEFYDDFSGAENSAQSVRQLLNIPSREIVEVNSLSDSW